MIKSRRMILAEHVAQKGRRVMHIGYLLVGKPERRRPIGRP
jgi:hypothetical protein